MSEKKYVSISKRYITLEGAKQAGNILQKNTVLVVCIGSTIGKVAITNKESVTNQQINAIICKDMVTPEYVYYAVLFRSQLIKNFSGIAAVPIIKKSLFEIVKIPIPKKKNEQKQIAEILSQVDRRLGLLKNKKEKLVRVKKGLMNDLFSGEKRVKLEILS